MKLTFLSPDGASFQLELPTSMTLADVRALVEADSDIPADEQRWLVLGREVKASAGHKTLQETAWGEEVVVQLGRTGGVAAQPRSVHLPVVRLAGLTAGLPPEQTPS